MKSRYSQDDIEPLKVLIGKELIKIEPEETITVPTNSIVKNANDHIYEIPLIFDFHEYQLSIFNNWKAKGNFSVDFEYLRSKQIASIGFDGTNLSLHIESAGYFEVDLSDEGFNGPEALVLCGPKNLITVWN